MTDTSASPTSDQAILIAIGHLDDRLLDLHNALRHLLRHRDTRAANVDKALAARKTHQAALDEASAHDKALAKRAKRYEQQRESAQRAYDTGTSIEAAERQLAECADLLDEVETEQLEHMEQMEALADITPTLDEAIATTTEARDSALPGSIEEEETLRAQQAEANAARDGHIAQLPRDLREKHNHIAGKKTSAVGWLLKDGSCHRCRNTLPLARASDARRGLLVTCDGCGRWILPKRS